VITISLSSVNECGYEHLVVPPSFEHVHTVYLKHRNPKPVATGMLRRGIGIDDLCLWILQGKHIFRVLTEVATTPGEEHDFHPYTTISWKTCLNPPMICVLL